MIVHCHKFLTIPAAVVLLFAAIAGAEEAPAKPEPEFSRIAVQGTVHFTPAAEDQFRSGFSKAHEFDFRTKTVRTIGKTRFVRVTFPSPVKTDVEENNTVYGEYFQPAGAGPFPACVVLHILGGDFLLAETVASHLAGRGIAALFVKMPLCITRAAARIRQGRMISEDPRESVAGMTQGVLDIRRATAWLAERSEVDPNRLGSPELPANHAGPGGLESRLKNVAVVLGDGGFVDFLWGQ